MKSMNVKPNNESWLSDLIITCYEKENSFHNEIVHSYFFFPKTKSRESLWKIRVIQQHKFSRKKIYLILPAFPTESNRKS